LRPAADPPGAVLLPAMRLPPPALLGPEGIDSSEVRTGKAAKVPTLVLPLVERQLKTYQDWAAICLEALSGAAGKVDSPWGRRAAARGGKDVDSVHLVGCYHAASREFSLDSTVASTPHDVSRELLEEAIAW